jgi:hypothetical protein
MPSDLLLRELPKYNKHASRAFSLHAATRAMLSMLLGRIGVSVDSPSTGAVQLVNMTGAPIRLALQGSGRSVLLPAAEDSEELNTRVAAQTATITTSSGPVEEIAIDVGTRLPPAQDGVIYVVPKDQCLQWLVMKRTDIRMAWSPVVVTDINEQTHVVYTQLCRLRNDVHSSNIQTD